MNILQNELDSINQKLEVLTYRKTQLDSIIDEYNDTLERVKNLVDSMNDVMVAPENLLMEIEKIVYDFELEQEETKQETKPILILDISDDEELCAETDNHIDDSANAQNLDIERTIDIDAASINEPEPVRLMMMIPAVTPEPIQIIDDGVEDEEFLSYCKHHQETSPPATPELQPTLPLITGSLDLPTTEQETPAVNLAMPIQLNSRAWRRGDTLLIGFSNKKLLNCWKRWIKPTWGDRVAIDDYEQLSGFSHCLSVLWFGSGKTVDWERLSNIDYSLRPDEQRF